MIPDPGLIRAVCLLVPAGWTIVAVYFLKPGSRVGGALLLSLLWNLPMLLAINLLAMKLSCWSFHADGGMFLGVPIDLLIGWALLWGPLAAIASLYLPIWFVVLIFTVLDILAMPACAPVVTLYDPWLAGEVLSIITCLIPGLYLVRWVVNESHLIARAILQMLTYAGWFLFILPAIALVSDNWQYTRWSTWTTACTYLLLFAALPGVSALQEFVTRGHGTPFPYDPTSNLVTTGPYAYLRNPMQTTTVLMFLVMAIHFQSWKLAAAAIITFAYSAGIAWWHESLDTAPRFGLPWKIYSHDVPVWIPRWTPWRRAPAIVYIAGSCEICQKVRHWIEARNPHVLEIRMAEHHPARDLNRITYEDGDWTEEGIAAVGRVLEHINFRWALIGMIMRLPILRTVLQYLCDILIAPPRKVCRVKS